MLYWMQSLDIHPASPATRDRVVETMGEVVPALERHGARLAAAWFAHEEWFSQILQVVELEGAGALQAFREATRQDDALAKGFARLAELAPVRREELLEPLGPVGPERLAAAAEECRETPQGHYTFAILEVAPGQMERFTALLEGAVAGVPIIASWRDVAGNPNRVIDLWKGDIVREGYRPNDPRQEAFFGPLREVAPRERLMRLHPLPYSPLQ